MERLIDEDLTALEADGLTYEFTNGEKDECSGIETGGETDELTDKRQV